MRSRRSTRLSPSSTSTPRGTSSSDDNIKPETRKSVSGFLFSIQGSNPRRFIISPKNGGGCCARTGRAGQAHTDLFVPQHNPFSLSHHKILSKSPSERTQRRSSQRERMRAGYTKAVVCGSRTLELPPNADMGAPRSP